MRTRLFLALLLAATLFFTNVAAQENIAHGIRVVVLDAGHGGRFPGACYASMKEKDLTLAVILRLGKLIEEGMPGVKVVYTRKTDKDLGATVASDLQARADIANRAEGDIFISVHANAAPSKSARGVETLIMGESPKEQSYNQSALFDNNRDELIDMSDQRTAAIVRAYIQNLQFTYGQYSMAMARCIQENYRQTGRVLRGVKPALLRVLYATDMPGVLTEIGFLSNAQEAAYLKSEKGQDEIAQSLYKAVREYSASVLSARMGGEMPQEQNTLAAVPEEEQPEEAKTTVVDTPKPEATPVVKPAEKAPAAQTVKADATSQVKPAGKVRYAIQVMASTKPQSLQSTSFKSYRGKVAQYAAEGAFRYKYCVEECAAEAEAKQRLSKVRRVFPGAFVVKCRDGKIVK